MLWVATALLYLLGCSQGVDIYRAQLEDEGVKFDTLKDKILFATTVACWPFIELYHLLFRGD